MTKREILNLILDLKENNDKELCIQIEDYYIYHFEGNFYYATFSPDHLRKEKSIANIIEIIWAAENPIVLDSRPDKIEKLIKDIKIRQRIFDLNKNFPNHENVSLIQIEESMAKVLDNSGLTNFVAQLGLSYYLIVGRELVEEVNKLKPLALELKDQIIISHIKRIEQILEEQETLN